MEEPTHLHPGDLGAALKPYENGHTSSAVEDSVMHLITKQGGKEGRGLGCPSLSMAGLRFSLCLNTTGLPSHNTAGLGISSLNFSVA